MSVTPEQSALTARRAFKRARLDIRPHLTDPVALAGACSTAINIRNRACKALSMDAKIVFHKNENGHLPRYPKMIENRFRVWRMMEAIAGTVGLSLSVQQTAWSCGIPSHSCVAYALKGGRGPRSKV